MSDWHTRFVIPPPLDGGHRLQRETSIELLGQLENNERINKIVEPTGPVLVASRMHPWFWNAAASQWDAAHLRDAIRDPRPLYSTRTDAGCEHEGGCCVTAIVEADTSQASHVHRFVEAIRDTIGMKRYTKLVCDYVPAI
jgi:hypothetical protein